MTAPTEWSPQAKTVIDHTDDRELSRADHHHIEYGSRGAGGEDKQYRQREGFGLGTSWDTKTKPVIEWVNVQPCCEANRSEASEVR